jgi:hypothetical protein
MVIVTSVVLSVLGLRKNNLGSRGEGEGRFFFTPVLLCFSLL